MIFSLILCIVSAWDIRYRKIPNWIILIGIIGGCFSHANFIAISPMDISWRDSLIGMVLVVLVLLPFWLKKIMGAGDVKFFLVLSIWLGWKILIPIWIFSVFIALLHFSVYKGLVFFRLSNLIDARKKFMPYGAYISLATVIALNFNK